MERFQEADISQHQPLPLRWLRAHGLRGLKPWHFIDNADEIAGLRDEFRREVSGASQPERDFLPFASRQDCDDVAGFVVEKDRTLSTVIVVHLTWRMGPEVPGFPRINRCRDIWEWLKLAIDEAALWCSEEDMPEISGGHVAG
jgi:hypothetical protein